MNVSTDETLGIGGRSRAVYVLGLVALLTLAYLAISWVFSERLIGPHNAATGAVEFADLGLPEPDLVSLANGEIRLAGWYFEHPDPAGCAAVMLHGFTGDRATILPFTPLLWDRGCHLLLYDLRGHGESTPALLTYGVHDKVDQLVAVDWLAQRTGLPLDRIGLWGVSYGAATSIQAAAEGPGLAFVIADASFSSLEDIVWVQAEQQVGAWARIFIPGTLIVSALRAGFDPRDAVPEDAIRGIATPVLLIHSTEDEYTPSTHSEAIHAAGDPSLVELQLTEWGAPHGQSYLIDPEGYTALVDDFLGRLAPGFGRDPGAADQG